MAADGALGEDRVLVRGIMAGLGERLGDGMHDPPTEHQAIGRRVAAHERSVRK